ncbi:10980_t:CDS:1 [Paraglomus occultum]|uniref:10980_t:CDS:1 n=1 Tax=Paraglomus occultum TaxID=144539 RepID=A0A9N9FRS7_9GLOM|nr:10980_t:CDS:1 [Paraglomus occultum]
MSHREAIEIVEELCEEIKRRDALAQKQVMSVVNAEHQSDRRNSTAASEVDQLEIVQKLCKEVEQLKRKTMEVMLEREKDHKHDVMTKPENEIEFLKSELKRTIEERDAAFEWKE